MVVCRKCGNDVGDLYIERVGICNDCGIQTTERQEVVVQPENEKKKTKTKKEGLSDE